MENEMTRMLGNDRFARLCGIEITRMEPGYAEARMEITDRHLNGWNVVQGGATFTLADYTFAAACNAKGRLTVATGNTIHYLRPATGKYLTARATELSSSRRLCSYRVEIFNDAGEQVAEMLATGYVKGAAPERK